MINIEKINIAFNGNDIIKDFSIKFEKGITAIMGPSGCGKTTLLHSIIGIIKADSGAITGIENKKISFVFSEPRLLPWYSVKKNVSLVNKSLTKAQLEEIMILCEIDDFSNKMPTELSAGMAQRVSIARSLAYNSDILLMDEPFKTLDSDLKIRILENIKNYFQGDYIIFITHDNSEANIFAERIINVDGPRLKIINEHNTKP